MGWKGILGRRGRGGWVRGVRVGKRVEVGKRVGVGGWVNKRGQGWVGG